MKKNLSALLPLLILALVSAGCSTSRNTAGSRFYHSTVTRYNAFFNGHEAYLRGTEAQEKDVKDNYIDILTLYPSSDPKVQSSGKDGFETAIEKAQKCIKLHSITQKPEKKKNQSEKDKAFQNKTEYNPFLWHAWMMMADAQMSQGQFLEAEGTYAYIQRIYADQPRIVAEAGMKRARCYSEMGWTYEADDLFKRIYSDSIPVQLKGEYNTIMASHLLSQQKYPEAIPYLENAIANSKVSRTQRIREAYLLGQLYKKNGDNAKAYDSFKRVIRMNPAYLVEFNARIQQTEVLGGQNSDAMLKKLNKMARDPNNKDYLEQVYYATGNIYLASGDTVKAIQEYETGVEKGTRNGVEKGILLQHLANIYWDRTQYEDAQRCYSAAVGLIDQDDPGYETTKLRSEVLEYLVAYTSSIQLQDSLQHLATLPEATIYSIIDNLIEELKEEEARLEEEAKKAEKEAGAAASLAAATSITNNDGSWYFYNPALIKEGQVQFNKTWGKRKLEDNWRRQNKSVLAMDDTPSAQPSDTLAAVTDSLSDREIVEVMVETDPHTREFYWQQIPFTDQAKEESDAVLTDALLNAGIIYKDDLTEYLLAEKCFKRITDQYPDAIENPDALYQLFLMYSLWGRTDKAQTSRDSLSARFPDNDYTLTICNPDFEENARYGKHREDSLYAETYLAYTEGNYQKVEQNYQISSTKYPTGQHRPKFMFLHSTSQLEAGDTDGFVETLTTIVDKYPENEISELAGLIVQGVRNGKLIQSGKFATIWDSRAELEESNFVPDSLREEFSADRYQPFLLVLAYPEDSINQNQLLFELARYNFTNYMMRNFDISFSSEKGIGFCTVSEFLNFDEAWLYRKRLSSDARVAQHLEGLKTILISPDNLKLMLSYYSINEYLEFFERTFNDISEGQIDGATLDEGLPTEEETE